MHYMEDKQRRLRSCRMTTYLTDKTYSTSKSLSSFSIVIDVRCKFTPLPIADTFISWSAANAIYFTSLETYFPNRQLELSLFLSLWKARRTCDSISFRSRFKLAINKCKAINKLPSIVQERTRLWIALIHVGDKL